MIALLSLFFVIGVSLLLVRIASTALVMTGITEEAAAFQARSALSGTGFTTQEAEQVVNHPVRRRIISLLMVLQNAGLVSAISALVLSFVNTQSTTEIAIRAGLLLAGLAVMMYLASSNWVDQYLSRLIEKALSTYTDLEVKDYYSLLNLEEDYTVGRVGVEENTWLADQTLKELNLPEEGVLILGIVRQDGSYVGAPRGRYTINPGETLILYGKRDSLARLKKRLTGAAGEAAHEAAKEAHDEDMQEQDQEERHYQAEQDEKNQEKGEVPEKA